MAVTLHWAFDQPQNTASVPNEGTGDAYAADTTVAILGVASFRAGSAMRTLPATYIGAGNNTAPPANIFPGAAGTVEVWARVLTYDGTIRALFEIAGGPYIEWSTLGIQTGSNGLWIPEIEIVDTWIHWAITWDGTTEKLYINGYLVDSDAAVTPAATAITVGYRGSVSEYGHADIADFKIHDVALTAAQLQAIIATAAPTTPRNRNRLLSDGERREQWAIAESSMPDRCTILRYEGATWGTVRADVPCRVIPQPVRSGVDATGDTVTFETAQVVVSARYSLPTFPFKVARFLVNGILWESLNLLIGADDVTRSIECKRVN